MNHETSASLLVLLIAGIGVAMLLWIVPAPAEEVCLTKKQARHLWPRQHIYWYSADHCWSNRRGGPPRGLKLEREPKPKRIKGDPVFNKINADGLEAVTWHMARAFDDAQPLHPPPVLLPEVPDDVWPELSEFDRRFVGVRP